MLEVDLLPIDIEDAMHGLDASTAQRETHAGQPPTRSDLS